MDIIKKYENRAEEFYKNSKHFISTNEFEKAGELLWGCLSNYINAINVLYTGKSISEHGKMVTTGKDIALAIGDSRLLYAIDNIGQKLHANYYHGFLKSDDMKQYYPEILYAITKLKEILDLELKKKFHTHSES